MTYILLQTRLFKYSCISYRPFWAEIRETHFSKGTNRENMEAIEKAAFLLCLDDSTPKKAVCTVPDIIKLTTHCTCTCTCTHIQYLALSYYHCTSIDYNVLCE